MITSSTDTVEVTSEDIEKFLEEGMFMINFRHPNVLSLIGVVFEKKDRPLVILPFMENGNLHSLISRERMVENCLSSVLYNLTH